MHPPTHEPGRLLRAWKVSQLLDVSVRHVYRLIHRGELEAVRVGTRHIRVTRESLDGLLETLRRDSPVLPDHEGELPDGKNGTSGTSLPDSTDLPDRANKGGVAGTRPSKKTARPRHPPAGTREPRQIPPVAHYS